MNAHKRPDSTSAALAKIERGIEEVKNSQQFRRYLAFSARFHAYSVNNQILIWLQRPQAKMVAGFHAWQKLGRHVLKGEKGIMIVAPVPVKREAKTQAAEEEAEEHMAVFFRTAYVFDVTQTEGTEVPSPINHLIGADAGIWRKLAVVAQAEGLHIVRESRPGDSANGHYARTEHRIWVNPSLNPLQAAKTLAHELAHHFARHEERKHNRSEAEMVAESAAFVVMAYCGVDSGEYSFGYLASWGDSKLLKARLQDIRDTAEEIISRMES